MLCTGCSAGGAAPIGLTDRWASLIRHAGLLRDKTSPEAARVSAVELFFDLVFVFAVTQLSHALLNNLTLAGLAETMFLFLAVWWVWIYTTWVTNWLDPERTPVRLLLFVLMLAGLVLSISIPTAFTTGAKAVGFWVPRLGRSVTADWDVEGPHLAERCGLFVIIALGESLLITGAAFGNLPVARETVAAFLIAFIGTAAMWWIYFAIGAERGSEQIAKADDPARLARIGYTYLHLPIIAGIVVGAVADELVLAHPNGHVETKAALAIIGGPGLFVLGAALFKRLSSARFPLSHHVGLVALAVLAAAYGPLSPLALAALATVTLVIVAIWEWVSLRGGRSRRRALVSAPKGRQTAGGEGR